MLYIFCNQCSLNYNLNNTLFFNSLSSVVYKKQKLFCKKKKIKCFLINKKKSCVLFEYN